MSARVSVLLWARAFDERLERTLAALAQQELDLEWELDLLRVGSDALLAERLEAFRASCPVPARTWSLHADEFDPGDVRNELAVRARGELLVWIEAGAVPVDPGFLRRLLTNFEDPEVALALAAHSMSLEGEAATREAQSGAHAFSGRRLVLRDELADEALVLGRETLALRRSVWERHPFTRGEPNVALARAVLAAGYTVVHDELARVEVGAGEGDAPHAPHARVAGPAAATALRPAGESLVVLFVVHGFPPDTWAGTEIYTLNLATELARLGHRVVILAREPAQRSVRDGGPPEFSLRPDEFEGLRVWRMTRRLEYDGLRETYEDPRAIPAFREVLLRERPDVVHFQHLIHSSTALVAEAKAFGLPTMVHLHDYWALCARVQLIRPTGTRCEENQGAGCYLCVHDRALSQVERFRDWAAEHPGQVAELVAAERAERDRTVRKRSPRGRRWQGLGDFLDRHEVVTGAYAAADLRVSPSRFLRDVHVRAGFDPATLLYSDNGMRTDHIRALEKVPDPEGRVRFGFVGSLVWYKGCEVMVRAMGALEPDRARLVVYGDYRPDEDPFHAELRELAGDSVEFRGRFDNSKLSEVYTEIDVLIVPSVWFENSPITIHEAFLAETPVVTSDVGGMAEYVRDGVDGLHFRVGDAEDLARVLRRFVDEPDLLAKLSGDWMEIKDIRRNAREAEYRYRQLLVVPRDRNRIVFYDRAATETSARTGPVEEQGEDMLLLRPGASVAYDVELAASGSREVRIELLALGSEPKLRLRGTVERGGRVLGRVEAERVPGEDRRTTVTLRVEFDGGGAPLELRSGRHPLRVCGVAVLEAPPEVPARRPRGALRKLLAALSRGRG